MCLNMDTDSSLKINFVASWVILIIMALQVNNIFLNQALLNVKGTHDRISGINELDGQL